MHGQQDIKFSRTIPGLIVRELVSSSSFIHLTQLLAREYFIGHGIKFSSFPNYDSQRIKQSQRE